jgi:hypothetical protein
MVDVCKNLWKISLRLPMLIYLMVKVVKNFGIFKSNFRTTKLLFDGLRPDRAIFSGNSLSAKKLYLLYDQDARHYNVITDLKAVMAKRYICNGCATLYDKSHKCDNLLPM